MAKTTVRVVYQTIDNVWHDVIVEEDKAQAKMDELRSLPDVKTETVRLSM